jgi:hypothetical protein
MGRTASRTAIAITGLAAIVALAWSIERRLGPDFLTVTPRGNSSVTKARRFDEFPVYSVGPSFRGPALNSVDQWVNPNRLRGATIQLGFHYGTCEIPRNADDGSCSLPLSIQNWPACEQTLADRGPYGHIEQIKVRGVPGRFYDSYRLLKLATQKTTIFLFGRGRTVLVQAARSLRGVNNSVGPTDQLPKPARGALDGTLGVLALPAAKLRANC